MCFSKLPQAYLPISEEDIRIVRMDSVGYRYIRPDDRYVLLELLDTSLAHSNTVSFIFASLHLYHVVSLYFT